MKKLKKIKVSNFSEFEIVSPSFIIGGKASFAQGTCLGTCCPVEEDGTVGPCEDWEDDE